MEHLMSWFQGAQVGSADKERVREKYRYLKFMQEDLLRVYEEMQDEGRKEVAQVRETARGGLTMVMREKAWIEKAGVANQGELLEARDHVTKLQAELELQKTRATVEKEEHVRKLGEADAAIKELEQTIGSRVRKLQEVVDAQAGKDEEVKKLRLRIRDAKEAAPDFNVDGLTYREKTEKMRAHSVAPGTVMAITQTIEVPKTMSFVDVEALAKRHWGGLPDGGAGTCVGRQIL